MSSVQREHEKSATRALDVESFARKLATGFPLDEIRVALERRGVEGDELSRLVDLAAELQRARGPADESTIGCPCCSRSFRTDAGLTDHLRLDHGEPQ